MSFLSRTKGTEIHSEYSLLGSEHLFNRHIGPRLSQNDLASLRATCHDALKTVSKFWQLPGKGLKLKIKQKETPEKYNNLFQYTRELHFETQIETQNFLQLCQFLSQQEVKTKVTHLSVHHLNSDVVNALPITIHTSITNFHSRDLHYLSASEIERLHTILTLKKFSHCSIERSTWPHIEGPLVLAEQSEGRHLLDAQLTHLEKLTKLPLSFINLDFFYLFETPVEDMNIILNSFSSLLPNTSLKELKFSLWSQQVYLLGGFKKVLEALPKSKVTTLTFDWSFQRFEAINILASILPDLTQITKLMLKGHYENFRMNWDCQTLACFAEALNKSHIRSLVMEGVVIRNNRDELDFKTMADFIGTNTSLNELTLTNTLLPDWFDDHYHDEEGIHRHKIESATQISKAISQNQTLQSLTLFGFEPHQLRILLSPLQHNSKNPNTSIKTLTLDKKYRAPYQRLMEETDTEDMPLENPLRSGINIKFADYFHDY